MKRAILITTIVVALTRLLAASQGVWDWDEALFSLGVREYEVAEHQPHPPGYPLFVAAAKVVHLFGVSEFRSLQVIALLGAFAIFPAAFFLARELGFGDRTSYFGALLYALLPNVWVYGGSALSDVPATALLFFASGLLWRGRHDSRAYLLGTLVLAISMGIRPQNILIAFVPGAIATFFRARESFRTVLAAALIGVAVVGACYGGAILASRSLEDFMLAIKGQREWVRRVDSYHNPGRPPLAQLARLFFFKPIQHRSLMVTIDLLAAIAVLAAIPLRRRPIAILLAMFGPYAFMAWLNFDFTAVSRYAIPYVFVHAMLVAETFAVAAMPFRRRAFAVQATLSGLMGGVLVIWIWPVLQTVRTTMPPPAAALEWVTKNVPKNVPVLVDAAIGPHATLMLAGHQVKYFDTIDQISSLGAGAYIVTARLNRLPNAIEFVRERGRTWDTVRQRHFEAAVAPLAGLIRYGAGWHGEEGEGRDTWRWMAAESSTLLSPVRSQGKLELHFYVPVDSLPVPPTIEVWFNGVQVDRFVATGGEMSRSYVLSSRPEAQNELRLKTSQVTNPQREGRGHDDRDLGLRVNVLSWTDLSL